MTVPPSLAAEAERKIGTTWSELHLFTPEKTQLTLPISVAALEAEEYK